ncbi:MAG: hypothetical protein DRG82_08675, partial [Deltaproteobacteria bacterium]
MGRPLTGPKISNQERQEGIMKEISRRDFVKKLAIGGAVLGLGSAIVHKPLEALASGKYDIGQCKSVRIKCV